MLSATVENGVSRDSGNSCGLILLQASFSWILLSVGYKRLAQSTWILLLLGLPSLSYQRNSLNLQVTAGFTTGVRLGRMESSMWKELD